MSTRDSKTATEAELAGLRQSVLEICELMRGPMGDLERALLHAERKELRARIAELLDYREVIAEEQP